MTQDFLLRIAPVLATALALGVVVPRAAAGAQSSAMSVSSSIPVTCTITALTDMAFSANIASTTGQSYDAQGSFSVSCTDSGAFGVSIPISGNGGGSTTQRRLYSSASSSYLLYNVYASAADRTAASPLYNTSATSTGQAVPTANTDQNYILYGRIPVQSVTPAVGSYTDTLTVTIGY